MFQGKEKEYVIGSERVTIREKREQTIKMNEMKRSEICIERE